MFTRTQTCYGELTDSTNQTPAGTSPVQATFNTTGLTHGCTKVNNGFTVQVSGVYSVNITGQVSKTGGGQSNNTVDVWLVKNGVAVAGSGVRNVVVEIGDNKVVYSDNIIHMSAGDSVKVYLSVDAGNVGAGLYAYAPAGEASIPSIMLTLFRIA